MERTKVILEHIVSSAVVEKDEDLEISIRILVGAIDRNLLAELSDVMLEWAERKVVERQIKEN